MRRTVAHCGGRRDTFTTIPAPSPTPSPGTPHGSGFAGGPYDVNPVMLAERLARIEERHDAAVHGVRDELRHGFNGVHERLDRLNGQTTANTAFRLEHAVEHRVDDAKLEARMELRRSDWAKILGVVGFAGAAFALASRVMDFWQ